jgi:hypothetical protein
VQYHKKRERPARGHRILGKFALFFVLSTFCCKNNRNVDAIVVSCGRKVKREFPACVPELEWRI